MKETHIYIIPNMIAASHRLSKRFSFVSFTALHFASIGSILSFPWFFKLSLLPWLLLRVCRQKGEEKYFVWFWQLPFENLFQTQSVLTSPFSHWVEMLAFIAININFDFGILPFDDGMESKKVSSTVKRYQISWRRFNISFQWTRKNSLTLT